MTYVYFIRVSQFIEKYKLLWSTVPQIGTCNTDSVLHIHQQTML